MKALAAALVAAQAEMPVVHKNAKANYGLYVTLDELIGKTKPVLNRHGLAITQFPAETTLGQPGLTTTLVHAESGESVSATVPLLLNGKNDMQALGGAITYARRYGWASVLGIANDEDDDGNQVSSAASIPSQRAGAATPNPSPGVAATSSEWTFPFGKHKGKTLDQVPDDYLDWVLAQDGKFEDVKARIAEHRLGVFGAAEVDEDIPF
jgi:hypothetical protein